MLLFIGTVGRWDLCKRKCHRLRTGSLVEMKPLDSWSEHNSQEERRKT